MNMYANGKGAGVAEMEDEWEAPANAHYASPELEFEWEMQEAAYPEVQSEWEDESEYFFKRALQGIKKVAKVAAPFAKHLAPIAAKTLVGAIPGVGVAAGPLAGKLVSTLLQEGEMEAAQMEAQFFGTNAAEAEVGNTEAAYEAALTEVLAAEASHSQSESEAVALVGTALPIVARTMGGRRSLRPIMPVLVQANARLVRLLHQRGPAGRQLLRLIPTLMRQTIASLRAAQRRGQPINSVLARRVMAAQAARTLGNSQTVTRAMIRNAIIRQQTVAQVSPLSSSIRA